MTDAIEPRIPAEFFADQIPSWAQRVVVLGPGLDDLEELLEQRGVTTQRLLATSDGTAPESGTFDCVVSAKVVGLEELGSVLDGVTGLTAPGAMLLASVCGEGLGVEQGEAQVSQSASARGWALYHSWEASVEGTAAEHLVALVKTPYDPVEHARRVLDEGRPDWAYEILSRVPRRLLDEAGVAGIVDADMVYCLLEMDNASDAPGGLERFFAGQCLLYDALQHEPDVTAPRPCLVQAFECQAELWHRIGDDGMAARLLRTLDRVAADDETRAQLARYEGPGPAARDVESPPDWSRDRFKPRVLVIMDQEPNYGLDVLYDGLCSVLGDENVVEYPFKGTLHGEAPRSQANYPCCFNRAGGAASVEDLADRVWAGGFDLVLFGDIRQRVDGDAVRRLVDAAGGTPLFVVDQEDDPCDNRGMALAHLGRERIDGYFKREMLACVDYGPGVFPLPLSYADGRVPDVVAGDRGTPVFWAGHRRYGLRRLYLETVEKRLGTSFDRVYTPEEYVRALADSRIALSIFGFGFDTVRYWEAAAHGCMLLAERLPIRIPHDFEDGVSAVFFEDLGDLEAKLEHSIAEPDEAAAIAQAGYEHLKRYHTASARAGQMLGWIQRVLGR